MTTAFGQFDVFQWEERFSFIVLIDQVHTVGAVETMSDSIVSIYTCGVSTSGTKALEYSIHGYLRTCRFVLSTERRVHEYVYEPLVERFLHYDDI